KVALDAIEHTFGRMESIWKPVAASEGFEIVRRRLFLDCKNPEGRDAVCSKFSQMYKASADYPVEAKEAEYRSRMIACYPIHPEVFDRLYEDWATLERFQKTRGVLRLMAAVIHELWAQSDASLMIMPGSFPLDVPAVRDELTRHLPDGWNALVDREVDGKNSMPWRKDQAIQRYGARMAARRVARAVMLGSAPTVRAQKVRGIEAARIRLGVIQPGENAANFIDALGTLETSLAYLYASGARYWYDTRPTLRKTVEDRAAQTSMFEVEEEIESRLMKLKKEKPFEGLHSCPSSSNGVPDERSARLVILRPCDTHDKSAMTAAIDILCNKGSVPRVFRNTLSFLAPDEGLMNSLNQAVRLHLAWQSIDKDKEALNLDAAQNNETKENLKKSFETVEARIKEAYCWLLVPRVDKGGDLKETLWEAARIIPGNEGIVLKAAKKMTESDEIITKWSQDLLLMELDGLLWKGSDHIGIKKLWECLCSYCYLPRLANAGVLDDAIKQGVSAGSFAYASGISEDRYEGLAIGQQVGAIDHEGYLVKAGVALKQLETQSADPPKPEPALPALATEKAPKRRFHMSADLANPNDVKMYMDEIIEHLSLGGAKVSISIEALAASGFSQQLIRAVSENCQALHVPEFNFEEQ
ncbi:MAG: DUF499 domain-containing protein, partial [Clostridiales bacterium]|nr:DUF499 domain-containing protein [Clostridiales bacterium]